jgi:tetratricopeptide (TPR) repeat protein
MRKIIIIVASFIFPFASPAQHPNRKKIDSLKNSLRFTKGISRVDCMNALSEEYWWLVNSYLPDSVSRWAVPAYEESKKINYDLGLATSLMHLGVADVYRKNFLTAEKYLRRALQSFEQLKSDKGMAWCNIWLGQDLVSQNKFGESISCYKKALPFFDKINDWEGKGKAWAWLGVLYTTIGDYNNGVFYSEKSLSIRKEMSDYLCVANALNNMGYFYRTIGAYEDAFDYYLQSKKYAEDHSIDLRMSHFLLESLGSLYRIMNMPDSSLLYLQDAILVDPDNEMTHVAFGETLLSKKQYDSALNIFLKPIEHFRKENDNWDLMRVLVDAAKANEDKGNEHDALKYVQEGLSIAKNASVKQFMIEGYLLLSKIYNHLHQNDSAYYFMQHYSALKDSLMNNQFVFRLSDYKKQVEFNKQQDIITSLDKDNKIKEERLKRGSLLRWMLVIGLAIAILTGIFIYRNLSLKRKNEKLENQKIQSDLQLRTTELEMRALRAQMNPHFIFNCLSSINRFILKNETEAASDYLTKFSRLIRMVLTNSNKSFISLEDELEMLRLYLDMERLRFKNSFDYSVAFTNSIDAGNVFVPPMLFQPFVENAIWHGLMHKEGQGQLEMNLSLENKMLTCVITDNGIGRSRAEEIKSKSAEKQKSLGLRITTERLALLNDNAKKKTFFNIEDIFDNDGNVTGTRVLLKMNYKTLSELTSDNLIART